MRKQLPAMLMLLALLTLAACAPTVVSPDTERPLITVINAPAETREGFLAEELESAVERIGAAEPYTFMRPGPIRFQETHRDMGGARAIRSASALARNLTADYAILVSAPTFERDVVTEGNYRYVDSSVQVEVVFVDPNSEERLVSFVSREYDAHRREQADTRLPDRSDDPDMRRLAKHALANVAPAVAAELDHLSREYRTRNSSAE